MDDILVFSRNLAEHEEHVRLILERLRQYGFQVKISKCEFAKQEITFLGHSVSNGVIKPHYKNLDKVIKFATPTKQAQVISFTALASYYRKFVKDYAKIVSPLRECIQILVGMKKDKQR